MREASEEWDFWGDPDNVLCGLSPSRHIEG